jgi:predicted nucleotidyltransferase
MQQKAQNMTRRWFPRRPKSVRFPKDALRAFCQRWGVEMFGLFGSALGSDFHHDSDVDVLVRFRSDSEHTLLTLVQMERELGQMIGHRVDLGEWDAVQSDFNSARRQHILDTVKVLYEV